MALHGELEIKYNENELRCTTHISHMERLKVKNGFCHNSC
jgi:hypothetical protein